MTPLDAVLSIRWRRLLMGAARILLCFAGISAAQAQVVSCQAGTPGPTVSLLNSAWTQNATSPANLSKGQALYENYLRVDYTLVKNDANLASVALRTNWGFGNNYVAAYNAMRFLERAGDAKGFGLRISDMGGKLLVMSMPDPGLNSSNVQQPRNYVWTYISVLKMEIVKLDDVTTGGPLGIFGSSLGWNVTYRKSDGTYDIPGGCTIGSGIVDFAGLAVAAPPPPPPPPMNCTFNRGNAINIALQPVYSGNLVTVGQPPTGNYSKTEFPLQYSCSTGGVINPNYVIKLSGTAAPAASSALASDKTNLGVRVDAVSSRGGATTTLVPNSTEMTLYDAGAAGGSTMRLISYPVRTQSGAIGAGSFQAQGTLEVFSQ